MFAVGNAFVGILRNVVEKIVNVKPVRYLVNWARLYSLWPVHLTTACCSVEFGAASCPRFDVERMGMIQAFGSLRQCDLIIIEGTVTKKMGKRVKKVYSQMASPRYVIAMGACAISGGIFYNSYNVHKGVDEILPVDVYVPGCPPRPEALAHGVLMLQDKIRKGRVNITKGE